MVAAAARREVQAEPHLQYSTVQYSTVQYSTVQYSTVQYSEVQAEPHRLRLQELGEVKRERGEEARHDVAHRALGVAD